MMKKTIMGQGAWYLGYGAGVGSIPAAGVLIGGIVCHTVADILNALNGYIDVPVGEPFEISKTKRMVVSFEVHKFE